MVVWRTGRGRVRSAQLGVVLLFAMASHRFARADAFEAYQYQGSFNLPAGATVFDVLNDGRILALVDDELVVESGPASHVFGSMGTLPAADFPSFGAAFVRVSPNGTRIAVGNNGGSSFGEYRVGVFMLSSLSGVWFTANHYDGEWVDDTFLALTSGDFVNPSVVTILDTTSPIPASPINTTIINGIGGASGGVALDTLGNLYTGNGFTTSGPSGTGAIKAFTSAQWAAALSGGPALNFESQGTGIVDVLSAWPLGFDAAGNLYVGGADFADSNQYDYAGLVRRIAIADALAGMGTVDVDNATDVRRLDPELANDFNFFTVDYNAALQRLYVRDGATTEVHVYQDTSQIPAVSQWGMLCLALLVATAGTLLLRDPHLQGGDL